MARLQTALCSLLKIQWPIVQAPIGSATCPGLAAAVSNAGGLGMLAATWRSENEIRKAIHETRALTDRPFGVNLVLQWPQEEKIRICLEEGVKVISFFWGDPSPHVSVIHQFGGIVVHTVGSTAEARLAARAGVDVVVAQGWEAGGHVRGTVAALPFVPAVVDAVGPVPVLAAGGIGDGRGVAAALVLGASGVWLGSIFLASEESAVHPEYKQKLVEATESDTVYSSLFDKEWPDAPHRTLRNKTMEQWEDANRPFSPKRPGENEIIAYHADGRPIERYGDTIPLPGMTGKVEDLALYAGQSVGFISRVRPAGQIVSDLVKEAMRALEALA